MVVSYYYSQKHFRHLPHSQVNINGVPVQEIDTWVPSIGHAGWERGYKKQSAFPVVAQAWRYNGEILHFELLSSSDSGSCEVTTDCLTFDLVKQSGLAWSECDRLQTLFAQPGAASTYNNFYNSLFNGGLSAIDQVQTHDPGSSRMAFSWHAYVWSKRLGAANNKAGTELMVAYMDEWLRLQVQRPYQWPNDDGTPAAPTAPTFPGAPSQHSNLPGDLDVVTFENQFGQNSWNHNHFTLRQLGDIYRLYKWPRALDQMIRLYWSAMREKGWGYYGMEKGYGTERAFGWLMQSSAVVLQALYPLAFVYPLTYLARYNEVLNFTAQHLNRAWGTLNVNTHYSGNNYATQSTTSTYTKEAFNFAGNVIDHQVATANIVKQATIPNQNYPWGLQLTVVHAGGTCVLRDVPTGSNDVVPVIVKSGVGTVVSGTCKYSTGEVDVTMGPGETISSAVGMYKHNPALYTNYYPIWSAAFSGGGHNLPYPYRTQFMGGVVASGLMQIFNALALTGNSTFVGPGDLTGGVAILNKAIFLALDACLYMQSQSWNGNSDLNLAAFYYDRDVSGAAADGKGYISGEVLPVVGGAVSGVLFVKKFLSSTLTINVVHAGGSCVLVSSGAVSSGVQQITKQSGAGTVVSASAHTTNGTISIVMTDAIVSATAAYGLGNMVGTPQWHYDGMKRTHAWSFAFPPEAGFPLSMVAFWEAWATPAGAHNGLFDYGNIDNYTTTNHIHPVHYYTAWLDPSNAY